MSSLFLPPATIGIIGGGQLGMMIVREAQRMGYRSVVWDPDSDCPAGRLADKVVNAPFTDPDAARRLSDLANVFTYEFENVDAGCVQWLEEHRPLYPGNEILRISQHRRREKEELRARGFPTTDFALASSEEELRRAIKTINYPAVVKTAVSGYDGKGQVVLRGEEEFRQFLLSEFQSGIEYVIEDFIDLVAEVSVISIRSQSGTVTSFPVAQNTHRDNILHTTVVPATIDPKIISEAKRIGEAVIEEFCLVGILCIEMFVTRDGDLLVNELAPRPHNSGHYSLDACDISQFEALVRAICGLPVPTPCLTTRCAMINILGRNIAQMKPDQLLQIPGVKLHMYGKRGVHPRRKMGHITVLGDDASEVMTKLKQIEHLLEPPRNFQVETSTR